MMKYLLAIVLAALICGAFLQNFRSNQFEAKIAGLAQALTAAQHDTTSPSPIPAIMEAYALRNGGRLGGPTSVRVVQAAEMRLAPEQDYFSLEASQISATRNPGFVWQASGRLYGVVPVRVVDSYVEGEGLLEVRLAGALPVATAEGQDTAKGEAMRFLAELPWNPDAILNASGLTWMQIDDRTVSVSMQTSGGVAHVTLELDATGDIIAIKAEDRPRTGAVPARWIGRFSQYERVGTYRFPRYGEVGWALPEGEFVYWRGTILGIEAKD